MSASSDISNFKSKLHQCLTAGIGTLGVFCLGTVLAWTSPALPSMKLDRIFRNMSTTDSSLIGSTAILGAFVGCPIAGLSTDLFGRKRTMQIFCLPFAAGWIVIYFANNVPLVCIGRFLSGLCGGVFSLSAPVLISETAESHIRGTLTSAFQLMLVNGILFTYIFGAFLNWSNLALICCIIPILNFVLLIPIRESPRYLLAQNCETEAVKAICWYRGAKFSHSVQAELDEVQQSIDESKKYKTDFRTILKPEICKPLAISLSLMILEQISAFNAVIFYSYDIFSAAGTTMDANMCSIIVAVVQVLATIVSSILVDKSGRRVLLLFSEAVMSASFIVLGTFFYLKKTNSVPVYLEWVQLASLILFIIAFSIGIGPLSWTIMGEILPPNVKGLCSAIATSVVWLSAFVVVFIYEDLVNAIGIDYAFWLFALFSGIGTVIVYIFVPETKGKSLDEIQLLFAKAYPPSSATEMMS